MKQGEKYASHRIVTSRESLGKIPSQSKGLNWAPIVAPTQGWEPPVGATRTKQRPDA